MRKHFLYLCVSQHFYKICSETEEIAFLIKPELSVYQYNTILKQGSGNTFEHIRETQ